MTRLSKQQRFERTIQQFIDGTPNAMYDIGVGPKSEWQTLATCYPTMSVFGCEPHPVTRAQVLERGFPGPLWEVALGETNGKAILHEPPRNVGGSSLWPLSDVVQTYPVEMWSLDQFDLAAGQPDRILLWIDIEGSELSALRSGAQLMNSGRVRWINLEERRNGPLPAQGWTAPSQLDAFLSTLGYTRMLIYNTHPTHQDVIYVFKNETLSTTVNRR